MITIAVIAITLAIWGVLELLLHVLIRWLRPSFQWLITSSDEAPLIPDRLVSDYLERSFDPELGWVRKPGSSGSDRSAGGLVKFQIDERGRRTNPGFEHQGSYVSVFGDSYAFCRLVEDNETWPHQLSIRLKTNVLNFGVGNYGLDQALLRLERENPQLESTVVVMSIVPETMARVHSYWKHYFEYGNILAFKPRFTIVGGQLAYHATVMRDRNDFRNYRGKLGDIQKLDPFYLKKFKRDQLRFPYFPRVVSRWRRHGPILWYLLTGTVTGHREEAWKKSFAVVMHENARITSDLYGCEDARKLLTALIERYSSICLSAGRTPVLMIVPQPVDLKRLDMGDDRYVRFFANLSSPLSVVDFSESFQCHPNRELLYVDGALGPHLSLLGNQLVADRLAPLLRNSVRLEAEGAT